MKCWKCGKQLSIENINRNSECSFCKADLHCCKACSFYSLGNHFDCKETVEELITEKERSNFCDLFKYNNKLVVNDNLDKAKAAKDAFNALFGD